MTMEHVSGSKAGGLLYALTQMTEGPKEAYGVLCLAIWLLNFEISENTVSIDELCDEITQSLRSIKKAAKHDA